MKVSPAPPTPRPLTPRSPSLLSSPSTWKMRDSNLRVIWAVIVPDTANLQDHQVFFLSGKRLLQKMAVGLIPSFLRRSKSSQPRRLHPTSYLDGLRGIASFIVFMGHYTEENIGWWTEPYGLYEDGARSSPLQLPFIRVIYSARPMVHIFFIISGYVLSYKPLKQIQLGQHAALANTLSSSIFRRGLRLFLPSIITLLVMTFAVHYGISDDRYAPAFEGFFEQLAHWLSTCRELLQNSWSANFDPKLPGGLASYPKYNPALWTIPIEFAQSLLLFMVIVGLSRCLVNLRLLLLSGIMIFCFFSGQIFALEFLGGMLIAEVTLLQDRSLITPTSSPMISPLPTFQENYLPQKESCQTSMKNISLQIFWVLNVICGLFISSWTNAHHEEVWGIRFLNAHTPGPYEGQAIWFSFAAFQIVIACTQVRFLQAIFTTPVAQYLGDISYSLYLMHNLCLTTLEPRVIPVLDMSFGLATFWSRHFTWLAGLLIYVPIILSVSDLFWRAVDTPTVKFAKWVEGKCTISSKRT